MARIARDMGWKDLYNIDRDGVKYEVTFVDENNHAHAFQARGQAMVFLVKAARQRGIRI